MKTLIYFLPLGLLALLLSEGSTEENLLHISSFNIQIFGITKADKPDVMNTLVQIVRRYDITLIQEIRDSSGTAIVKLLEEVNAKGEPLYSMEISERLGRTRSKEQYAFLYRTNAGFKVAQTYQYQDPEDIFQREPFAVKFMINDTSVREIVLAGIHTEPDKAPAEIDGLDAVHTKLQQQMGTDNILILGDLNADCNYVSKTEMSNLILRKDPKYHWLIEDDIDTTVSGTDCAYDRFILTGEDFLKRIVLDSAKVFRFDTEYELTHLQAEDVSDHYPIELTMALTVSSDHGNASSGSSMMSNLLNSLLDAITDLLVNNVWVKI